MTQYVELVVEWNRGAGWERPKTNAIPGEIATSEVPVTVGTEPAPYDLAPYPATTGAPLIASHITTGEDPAAQAAAICGLISHKDTPIMLYPPMIPVAEGLEETMFVADAMIAKGLKPRILYMPEFYWRALGSPDLWTPLNSRGMAVMIEAYTFGAFGNAYYGDDDPRWVGYGGMRSSEIAFLRPTDAPYAAFRGTIDQLDALLTAPVPNTSAAPPTAAPEPGVTILAPAIAASSSAPATPAGVVGLAAPAPVFPTLEQASQW